MGAWRVAPGGGAGAATIAAMLFWNPLRRRRLASAAERFRREHSLWLTRAMLTGTPYPRIPSRRVDAGGFDGLRRREGGPGRAERWWSAALTRVEGTPGGR